MRNKTLIFGRLFLAFWDSAPKVWKICSSRMTRLKDFLRALVPCGINAEKRLSINGNILTNP